MQREFKVLLSNETKNVFLAELGRLLWTQNLEGFLTGQPVYIYYMLLSICKIFFDKSITWLNNTCFQFKCNLTYGLIGDRTNLRSIHWEVTKAGPPLRWCELKIKKTYVHTFLSLSHFMLLLLISMFPHFKQSHFSHFLWARVMVLCLKKGNEKIIEIQGSY